jgi:hypothetical protein
MFDLPPPRHISTLRDLAVRSSSIEWAVMPRSGSCSYQTLRQDFVVRIEKGGNPGLACLSDNTSKMERTAVPCSPYWVALFREIGRAVCTFWETPV